jgi:hypothetical protein
MKTIFVLLVVSCFAFERCSAQTFGLGPEEPPAPVIVQPPTVAETFGLNDFYIKNVPLASNFPQPMAQPVVAPVAVDVYETVNVVTRRKVCENGVCRIVENSTAKPAAACPCGCGLEGCSCGVTATVASTGVSVGSPAPGNHQHTDPITGQVWEHSDANVGNYAAHVSPFTGTYVTDRSAESYSVRTRVGPLRGFLGRFRR